MSKKFLFIVLTLISYNIFSSGTRPSFSRPLPRSRRSARANNDDARAFVFIAGMYNLLSEIQHVRRYGYSRQTRGSRLLTTGATFLTLSAVSEPNEMLSMFALSICLCSEWARSEEKRNIV